MRGIRLGITTCDKCGEVMNNSEIAEIFRDIAALLELKGENPFKIRAYQKVARSIKDLWWRWSNWWLRIV